MRSNLRTQVVTCFAVLCVTVVANGEAQLTDSVPHAVDCHPLAAGVALPVMGCTILGERTLTRLPRVPLYWYLVAYRDRAAADAAAGPSSVVADAEGRHWVFSIGPKKHGPVGGQRVARVGPLPMPHKQPFVLSAATAVLPPGASSRVHEHAGPEAWYLLTGEQCLETRAGTKRAGARHTMIQPGYTPMQLNVTGKETRHALFIVLHDSATTFAIPSTWTPSGRCNAAR
jgi:hypothetical protein